ncbi:Golgi to ER traffic protein 4 homolog [Trichuris trichiura]|uniref:Golgi to ER traffic protein 4 homolog n=1 Tax=Trichuris trichiura TaxID=36087 RepID=A0A077Z3F3_TRITR|nr:Golgi to ER traffic protein 4 homolog [Trichuris trichiura]
MSTDQLKGKSLVRGSEAIQKHLQASNYYEALQLCRAIGSRLTAQKKIVELLDFLEGVILTFAEAGKASSVDDLAKMFTNALLVGPSPLDSSSLEKIKTVFSALKPRRNYTPDREQFLNHLIAWSKQVLPKYTRGSPALHLCIAEVYALEDNGTAALRHFQLSQNGPRYGEYLALHQDRYGIQSEADLTIAQAVLQRLCMDEKDVAIELFDSYMLHHPKLASVENEPPLSTPLLNFIHLLLRAIVHNRLNLFTALVEAYKPSIDRDPIFNEYLEKIAQINFASCPLSSRLPRFLDNVLNSILTDGELENDFPPKPSNSRQNDQATGSASASQNGATSTSATVMTDEDLD